jgi:NADH-quinone oxidoreductase subunit L
MAVAWAMYGTGRIAVPRFARVQRALEHKLYFDEAYDAIFYRPAAAFASWLRRDFEEPVILTAGPDVGETVFDTGRGVSRLQTGMLRTYVFFLGTGMAVLAIVFLLVR